MDYIGANKKSFPNEKLEVVQSSDNSAVPSKPSPISDGVSQKQHLDLAGRGFFARLWIRWWRHYKRYWICYLIAGIIFLAIFLPILFLVIFPAAAQSLVNKANLPVLSASIFVPTPDSILISLEANLKVPKPFSVTLEPFNLSLYNPSTGVEFVSLALPEYHLKGDANMTVANQTVQIQNMTEFVNFLHNAVYSETFVMSTRGSTNAYLGKLKAYVNLDKSVQMNGLNKLAGFGIVSAEALLPAQNGANIAGTLDLPNRSVVTFAMGNETLNLLIGDLNIGYGTLYNVVLYPGNNTLPFTGSLNLKTLIQNIVPIIKSESSALLDGNLGLSASGNSTIYDGYHIPYYEDILNNLTLSGEVPIMTLLGGTLGSLLNSSAGTLSSLLGKLNTTASLGALGGLTNLTETEL